MCLLISVTLVPPPSGQWLLLQCRPSPAPLYPVTHAHLQHGWGEEERHPQLAALQANVSHICTPPSLPGTVRSKTTWRYEHVSTNMYCVLICSVAVLGSGLSFIPGSIHQLFHTVYSGTDILYSRHLIYTDV